MTITIHSTSRIVDAGGIRCRVWQGKTESGIDVQVLVPRIAAAADADLSQFERELEEVHAPAVGRQAFPLRMVI